MNDKKQLLSIILQKKKAITIFITNITLNNYGLLLSTANKVQKIKSHYIPERKSTNLIDTLGINENGHSTLLAEILNFTEKKEYVFLNDFVHSALGFELIFDHQTVSIKAEDERIDLLIFDANNCLIIENKINNAIDQPEQLKRYIDKCKARGYQEENIHLLYLTDMKHEKDLSTTLSNYAESFKEKSKVIAYHPSIIDWLASSVLPNIRHKDNDFYCFTSQYIDHLNGRFFKRPEDSVMNNEINEFICEQFGLKEGDLSENINKLEEELKSVNELQSRMNTILSEQKEKIFSEWALKLRQDFPILNVQEGKEGELTKTGILFNNEPGKFSILIEKTVSSVYFGIGKHFTGEPQLNDDVDLLIRPLMNGFRRSEWWYGWKNTSYEKGYYELCQLINDYLIMDKSETL